MQTTLFQKSIFFFSILFCCSFSACTNEKGIPDFGDYPTEIGKLMVTKCATTGCHTDTDKEAAGGLSLQSWDALFKGGHNGATVIPYRSDFSSLFLFTNTYEDLGAMLMPTMPYNKPALSKDEVTLIKNWIDNGAPDLNGLVKFSDNPTRKKYYVTNQGCDVVTVFDQASGLPMRYINVGQTNASDLPHMVKISPDKQYWYVLCMAGQYLEKFRASDDGYAGRAFIGSGNWNAFTISSNSQTAYCTDLSAISGKVATVDLASMTATTLQPFNYPHGIALNSTDDTLYVTQQVNSSALYKIPVSDFSGLSQIPLFTGSSSTPLNPHEVAFSPDGSKYFVTCQGTSEIRVFKTGTDQLLATIAVGSMPSEMSFSATSNYLFVSCTEDTLNFPGKRGSVAVLDYVNNSFVKFIYTGHQPHGIAVDDTKKIVVVVNRNFASDGPAPHHSNMCGGRNGYVSYIDLTTLQMILSSSATSIKSTEVSADPYSVGVR
jgi:DNA-binding beta-propeller fold protein YncE